jgi:RimJ/RimL family protein N-acetyltransferase
MDEDFRLETERLRLRRYRQDDLEDLLSMFSDPEHMRWYPEPFTREGTQEWLDRQLAAYDTRGYALWIVEDRVSGAFLGTAGPTNQEVEGVGHVEIGWHTKPGRKGEGIAPEAAAAARDWAFASLEVDHLISLVRPENRPSGRVAEKIGMHVDRQADYKGLLHNIYRIDLVTWARVREGGRS